MYNAERWIKRCIESIVNQSFQDFELIIVNDGSTDHSLNIVKSYCRTDNRIRCISTENQGSAMAKNVALKHLSGDIVTFVDADDFIEDMMYEAMISVMDRYEADIVESSCRKINSYGRELDRIELLYEEIEGNEKCIIHFLEQKNTRNYMCNKIYKRKLFDGIYFPSLCFSEDYYMNAILHSKIKKKIVMPQIFYNYMIYPGQSTDKRSINEKRLDGMKAGNMIADFFSYDKRLKSYAGLYACSYALVIADIIYDQNKRFVKRFIKQIRRELFKSLFHVSFHVLNDENDKKIICQCFLMLVFNTYFYDFRWLFE